eukprot:GHVR01148306.1.p1 GENE.GHVR01148306.1~~GHVR01148306.1.p1  ORF type:complete len:282 (+),score=131.37 GHVR01148306.1:341-1186(+)
MNDGEFEGFTQTHTHTITSPIPALTSCVCVCVDANVLLGSTTGGKVSVCNYTQPSSYTNTHTHTNTHTADTHTQTSPTGGAAVVGTSAVKWHPHPDPSTPSLAVLMVDGSLLVFEGVPPVLKIRMLPPAGLRFVAHEISYSHDGSNLCVCGETPIVALFNSIDLSHTHTISCCLPVHHVSWNQQNSIVALLGHTPLSASDSPTSGAPPTSVFLASLDPDVVICDTRDMPHTHSSSNTYTHTYNNSNTHTHTYNNSSTHINSQDAHTHTNTQLPTGTVVLQT